MISRRRCLQHAMAWPWLAQTMPTLAANHQSGPAKVVVVGGGFAGATAAKYLRLWSAGQLEVTLIESATQFVSCPLSNLVLGGSRSLQDLTLSYDGLAKHGVRCITDLAMHIDAEQRQVVLRSGIKVAYDRLVLAPGVAFDWGAWPHLAQSPSAERPLHAWKAGPETWALRQQLQAMPDGGVFVMSIPKAPYRCPPGPYERACQVAHYFSQAKRRSKVLVLDANDDVVSKAALFKQVWQERYAPWLEYRPRHDIIDIQQQTVFFDFDDPIRADVLNIIPPMRAPALAQQTGLVGSGQRWCEVDFLNLASRHVPHVHVLGDAIQAAPAMPKSAHMANQHAKVCAAAIVAELQGNNPVAQPQYINTCYSFINDQEAMHVASVHRYDEQQHTMLPVTGAGGLSARPSELEGHYAWNWAQNIWADALT